MLPQAGADADERNLMNDKMILFVCSGNTCRSPMAEALAGHLDKQQRCISAGTRATPGQPASGHALKLLRERGIDWQGVSQRLSAGLLAQCDLVLVMTHEHRYLVEQMLAAAGITQVAVELLADEAEIADPYGKDLACYRHCLAALEAALNHRFNPKNSS